MKSNLSLNQILDITSKNVIVGTASNLSKGITVIICHTHDSTMGHVAIRATYWSPDGDIIAENPYSVRISISNYEVTMVNRDVVMITKNSKSFITKNLEASPETYGRMYWIAKKMRGQL